MLTPIHEEFESQMQRDKDLKRVVLLLIARRWWIAGAITLSIVVAGVISFVVTPIYLAKTTLVPADNDVAPSAIAGALGQLGGLAEIAGLQGPQDQTVVEAIALLQSRQFTEEFISDKNLLPVLFSNRWDARLNRWKPYRRIPDLWDGYLRFDQDIRFVDQDDKTGVVTLRIEWKNRFQAADWANELVRRVNYQMQQRALKEAQTTLAYLQRQVQITKVASVQGALQDLIEENLKKEAIASVRSDYVFRVVDPAAPPNERDKLRPHKVIYLITGAFFGTLLALLTVFAIDRAQNLRRWLRVGAPQPLT